MNLFEQQALMQKQLTPPAPLANPVGESPMLGVARFIEGATLEQCSKVAIHLSARLYTLEKRHSGMKAANLSEAAQFVADAAVDIEGARQAEGEAPCRCGRCDGCAAARSDEHYDRRRDALAA